MVLKDRFESHHTARTGPLLILKSMSSTDPQKIADFDEKYVGELHLLMTALLFT
jgi:hypothetical protein